MPAPFFIRAALRTPVGALTSLVVLLSALHSFFLTRSVAAQSSEARGSAREPGHAAGGQPSWAVEVAANSMCANEGSFAERLNDAIPERQQASLERAELRARVSVARDRTASLAVYDQLTRREAGQRQITLPSGGCREAAEALALVIAVMVEAGRSLLPAVETPAEPPPEPPKQPEPEKEPEPAPPARQEQGEASYQRPERYAWQGPPVRHDLTAQVGVGLGLLPGESLGGNIGWGLRGSRIWPVWVEATGWLNQPSQDLRARIGAAYGLLSTCPLYLKARSIRGRLCPGIAMGALWAYGRRLPDASRSVRLLTMGALVAAAHVRIFGPLELVLTARMEIPFVRQKFVYRRADGESPRIYEQGVVAGSFYGGLGLCFR